MIKKIFQKGDRIVPEKGAEFKYPLKECVLEVEHQLFEFENQEGDHNDTYVHLWRAIDKSAFYKYGKRSFAICSRYFRKISQDEEAQYLLEEL